jgi:RNA polymerase sigma-70 factor (ECF subfamily)
MNDDSKNPTCSANEDRQCVKAFQAGDKAAFDTLVLKHKDKIFNLCYWFLGDREEANDLAQDVFIKVYRSLKKFKLNSAFSTWLYRIAANTCKNKVKSLEYRQKKKMVWIDNPAGHLDFSKSSAKIQDGSPSPMIELEKKDRMMVIQKAIRSLPTEQRTVVMLRDIEGFSYEEIANITRFNLGTVKSKLSRARLELREKLRGMI